MRDGSFTDEWGIVQHITAFYLDTNIHIIGTANTESNPYTVIASSNNLDLELWVGYTQDYEGLKDGHYDSLKCLDNFAINGFTSGIRIESGTAQMSADSMVLDSDIGLFSAPTSLTPILASTTPRRLLRSTRLRSLPLMGIFLMGLSNCRREIYFIFELDVILKFYK